MSEKNYRIYCHFSFKRPNGKNYGLFAVAFYYDLEGKQLIGHRTRREKLWINQQFVTAIQSYRFALQMIHEAQGRLRENNIGQVILVTDNSTLAGWIENPNKNKAYSSYMEKAVKLYRTGGAREIVLGVGLGEVRKAEKSYKYCKESLAENKIIENHTNLKGYKISLEGLEAKSIYDILKDSKDMPEIDGITNIEVSED